jgi:hypothetical protein
VVVAVLNSVIQERPWRRSTTNRGRTYVDGAALLLRVMLVKRADRGRSV